MILQITLKWFRKNILWCVYVFVCVGRKEKYGQVVTVGEFG